jgi:hypothetical protein
MLRHRTPQHTRVPSCAVIVGTTAHNPLPTLHSLESPTSLPSLPLPSSLFTLIHTAIPPRSLERTSANTTRDCPAEARMLTALSIEQYSFDTFTTLLYRPPCGGIALDVYNYS